MDSGAEVAESIGCGAIELNAAFDKDTMTLDLRIASDADSADVADLVNRAYRPDENSGGWTHESNMLAGPRISAQQVGALFGEKSAVLLLCDGARLVACVYVQGGEAGAYIGMLATDPARQVSGIGKQMLDHAEQYARQHFGAARFDISVLSGRPELLAFYERRGYVLTGEVEDFPVAAGVGEPKVDNIQILSLVKQA